jgi:hypothetical protein
VIVFDLLQNFANQLFALAEFDAKGRQNICALIGYITHFHYLSVFHYRGRKE